MSYTFMIRASSIATISRKACGSDLTSRRFHGKEEKGDSFLSDFIGPEGRIKPPGPPCCYSDPDVNSDVESSHSDDGYAESLLIPPRLVSVGCVIGGSGEIYHALWK
jgi:hypothetical protein